MRCGRLAGGGGNFAAKIRCAILPYCKIFSLRFQANWRQRKSPFLYDVIPASYSPLKTVSYVVIPKRSIMFCTQDHSTVWICFIVSWFWKNYLLYFSNLPLRVYLFTRRFSHRIAIWHTWTLLQMILLHFPLTAVTDWHQHKKLLAKNETPYLYTCLHTR